MTQPLPTPAPAPATPPSGGPAAPPAPAPAAPPVPPAPPAPSGAPAPPVNAPAPAPVGVPVPPVPQPAPAPDPGAPGAPQWPQYPPAPGAPTGEQPQIVANPNDPLYAIPQPAPAPVAPTDPVIGADPTQQPEPQWVDPAMAILGRTPAEQFEAVRDLATTRGAELEALRTSSTAALAERDQQLAELRELRGRLELERAAFRTIASRWLWRTVDVDREMGEVRGLTWDADQGQVTGTPVYEPPRLMVGNQPSSQPATSPAAAAMPGMPQPRFDPYTGDPLPASGAPGQRFDPYTGAAVNQWGNPVGSWTPPGREVPAGTIM